MSSHRFLYFLTLFFRNTTCFGCVPIHSISEQHLLPYTTIKVVFKICFLNLCLSFGLLTPDDG